jgi:hypothetical protein
MFKDLGAAHMNWARVWMTFWDGKALEWAPSRADSPPIGQFSLKAAKQWDDIFDAAAVNGVYIQMTLQHHGQYTAQTDPNWRDNPFNASNGGFLKTPDAFFTDTHARELTRAKYRYIVARWGYSTHLLSFELFNEVQNIGEARGHFDDVVNWHKEMAATIRRIDVNHHLITTSNSDPGTQLANIGLDYDQIHNYTPDIISFFASLTPGNSKAPVFVGEWGPSGDIAKAAPTFLHDGIWSSLMAPMAGQGQFWYWDETLKQNWWPQFASAASFVRQFGVDGLTEFSSVKLHAASTGPRVSLVFNPPTGWASTTRFNVTLPNDGSLPDLSGMSYFIQGSGHRDMMSQPLTFELDAPTDCRLTANIGSTSKGGSHPTLSLDGGKPVEEDFPASGKDTDTSRGLSIDVSAGKHTVSLFNTGSDWFTLNNITVTRYVPAVGVIARQNSKSMLFWVYNRNRDDAQPVNASITLDNLPAGNIDVKLWNTWTGAQLPSTEVRRQGKSAILTLNGIVKDVAGMAMVK